MIRIAPLLALTMLIALLGGCAGRSLPNLPPAPSGNYTLDSGDKIQVTVFGEQRLTGSYTVGDNGQISMPLLGPVEARGKTVVELQNGIVSGLQRANLVLNPGVSVQVEQFRPFFILGEVERPGQYPYVEGMSVLTAVAIGGGFTFRAEKNYVSVTRTVDGESKEYKATRDSDILPGDTIYVFERYL